MRAAKPNEDIFEIAIDRTGITPAETVYIDDLAANCDTGRRLGFRTHEYDPSNHEAFISFLQGEGVVLWPAASG